MNFLHFRVLEGIKNTEDLNQLKQCFILDLKVDIDSWHINFTLLNALYIYIYIYIYILNKQQQRRCTDSNTSRSIGR